MKDESSEFFARAIYTVAKKKNKNYADELFEELQNFKNLLSSEKNLLLYFNHPSIIYSKKAAILDKLISNGLALRLIKLLVKLKKINSLQEINDIFLNMMKKDSNYIDAEVMLPFEPDINIEKKLNKELENLFNKKINLIKKITPEIIGGILLKIENKIYDYTVLTQLNSFEKRFKTK